MDTKTTTIKQRVAERMKELSKEGPLHRELSVVLGHREQAQMLLEADTSFFADLVSGNMNLCGRPVVIKNVMEYFAVEVYKGKREFKSLSKGAHAK